VNLGLGLKFSEKNPMTTTCLRHGVAERFFSDSSLPTLPDADENEGSYHTIFFKGGVQGETLVPLV
jgi:hypothetical protein